MDTINKIKNTSIDSLFEQKKESIEIEEVDYCAFQCNVKLKDNDDEMKIYCGLTQNNDVDMYDMRMPNETPEEYYQRLKMQWISLKAALKAVNKKLNSLIAEYKNPPLENFDKAKFDWLAKIFQGEHKIAKIDFLEKLKKSNIDDKKINEIIDSSIEQGYLIDKNDCLCLNFQSLCKYL